MALYGNPNTVSLKQGNAALSAVDAERRDLWRGLVTLHAPCLGRFGDRWVNYAAVKKPAWEVNGPLTGVSLLRRPNGGAIWPYFNGTNQYVASDSVGWQSRQLTLFALIHSVGGGLTGKTLASQFYDVTPCGWVCGISDSTADKLKFYTATAAGAAHTLESSTSMDTNYTQTIAFTYDGAVKRIYMDGLLDASHTWSSDIGYSNTSSGIGWRAATADQYWTGQVGLIAFWNRAMSAKVIRELHTDPVLMFRKRRTVGKTASTRAFFFRKYIIGRK